MYAMQIEDYQNFLKDATEGESLIRIFFFFTKPFFLIFTIYSPSRVFNRLNLLEATAT